MFATSSLRFWDQSLLDLFHKGGPVMWALLACSCLGLMIIVDRLILLVRIQFNYSRFVNELLALVKAGDFQKAITWLGSRRHPVAQVALASLEHRNHPQARQDAVKRIGSYAAESLETRLGLLASLSHVAPLLGLLGTVTGLVTAFHNIEQLGGQVQPGDLAGGIWEALITTVFGLVVAIPCMLAYRHFDGVVDRIVRQMQLVVAELDLALQEDASGAAP